MARSECNVPGAGENMLTKAEPWTTVVSHVVHRHFIWLLVVSYAIAAVFPACGLTIRAVSLGEITFLRERTHVSLPMLMLAFLLLNAGLGVKATELRKLHKAPRIVLGGLAANLLVPLAFVFLVSQALRLYHDHAEAQQILVGLALIAAMPIAGSSTAWTQNSDGDVTLSLALVLFSTLLSPLTTPLAFDAVEHMAVGEYADALDRLESNGTGFLLIACVLFPSVIGIALQWLLGPNKVRRVMPLLKLVNSGNLLHLNYANAAVSLPQLVAKPDWDWLALTLGIVLLLCLVAFASGWCIARLLQASRSEQISLVFGLGMNNNGAGLVLASMALAQFPAVMLPVIFYNLIQHLFAGVVDSIWCGRTAWRPSPA
jgi:BASS family bile acid:Na+ symporter